jgi:hypothetical protein
MLVRKYFKWHTCQTRLRTFLANRATLRVSRIVYLSLTLWFVVWLIGYALHFRAEMLAGVTW